MNIIYFLTLYSSIGVFLLFTALDSLQLLIIVALGKYSCNLDRAHHVSDRQQTHTSHR